MPETNSGKAVKFDMRAFAVRPRTLGMEFEMVRTYFFGPFEAHPWPTEALQVVKEAGEEAESSEAGEEAESS